MSTYRRQYPDDSGNFSNLNGNFFQPSLLSYRNKNCDIVVPPVVLKARARD